VQTERSSAAAAATEEFSVSITSFDRTAAGFVKKKFPFDMKFKIFSFELIYLHNICDLQVSCSYDIFQFNSPKGEDV